jgi:hypothetical protein
MEDAIGERLSGVSSVETRLARGRRFSSPRHSVYLATVIVIFFENTGGL